MQQISKWRTYLPYLHLETLRVYNLLADDYKNTINTQTPSYQGHPTAIFGKYLFGRRFEIYNFRNICCKISCLPASPRIFEHLQNGIITHF